MVVRLRMFGAVADAVGFREQEIEILETEFVGEVIDRIVMLYPRLSRPNLLVAVNQEYAGRGDRVKAGDEIAIFTQVSGG